MQHRRRLWRTFIDHICSLMRKAWWEWLSQTGCLYLTWHPNSPISEETIKWNHSGAWNLCFSINDTKHHLICDNGSFSTINKQPNIVVFICLLGFVFLLLKSDDVCGNLENSKFVNIVVSEDAPRVATNTEPKHGKPAAGRSGNQSEWKTFRSHVDSDVRIIRRTTCRHSGTEQI